MLPFISQVLPSDVDAAGGVEGVVIDKRDAPVVAVDSVSGWPSTVVAKSSRLPMTSPVSRRMIVSVENEGSA